MLVTIISGGQTGVDRAALDWALANGLPHGGWCPKGRRAEDGVIPARYDLQETPQRRYQQRTRWNVRDADATLLITLKPTLTGGTQFTRQCAESLGKPWLHVFLGGDWPTTVRAFLASHHVRTLNVAGPRASTAPGIERFVHEVLSELISERTFRDLDRTSQMRLIPHIVRVGNDLRRPAYPALIKTDLARAQADGFDPKALYETSIKAHRANGYQNPVPTWEDVAPIEQSGKGSYH